MLHPFLTAPVLAPMIVMRGQWAGKWNPVAAADALLPSLSPFLFVPLSSRPFAVLSSHYSKEPKVARWIDWNGVDVALRQFIWGVLKFFGCMAAVGEAPFRVRDEISGKFMLLIARWKGEKKKGREPLSKPVCAPSQGYLSPQRM